MIPTSVRRLALLVSLFVPSLVAAAEWVVPGVSNAPGANGTHFVSDLLLTNSSTSPTSAELSFIPMSGRGAVRTVTVGAGESVVFTNVLESLFGVANNGGALQVRSDAPLEVVAKTYNHSSTGTFGMALPVVGGEDFLTSDDVGISPWISQSDDSSRGFRTNVAVVFPEANGGAAIATFFDASGMITGARVFDSPAPSFTQLPLSAITAPDAVRMTLQVTRGRGFGYTAVVDNVSGDSSVFGTERSPAEPDDVVLSGVARTAGANGTYFTTDLRLVNLESDDQQVTLRWLQPSVDNYDAAPVTIRIRAGETLEISDVLGRMFGATDGAGALRVTSARPLLAAARTYNSDPSGARPGTFGAQQLAVSIDTFTNPGKEPIQLTGLRQNAQFRSNLGFTAGPGGVDAGVVLFDSHGMEIARRDLALPAFAWTQANAQQMFGTAIPDDSRVVVTPVAGSLTAYASIVDQQSGDSAIIAAPPVRCATVKVTAPAEVCLTGTAVAAATPIAGAMYAWSAFGAAILSGQGTPQVAFAPTSTGTLQLNVTVTFSNCSRVSGTSVLATHPVAIAGATVEASVAGQPATARWSYDRPPDADATIVLTGSDFASPVVLAATATSHSFTPSGAGHKELTLTIHSSCGSSQRSVVYDVQTASGYGPGSNGAGGPYPGTQAFPGVSGREYVVYVPASYSPAQPARLVFALGGQGMSSDLTLRSGWQSVADRENVLIATLTPSSSGPGYSGAYDVAEFETIEKAEEAIPRMYNVALKHVSYWGFSAGAHVTYMMALLPDRSNRVNAIAIHAGALEAAATRTSPPAFPPQPGARKLAVYISCGTEDTTGSGGGLIGALRRNAEMLRNAGYPVTTREVAGQKHTYTRIEVERAWDFLSAQTLP